MTDRNNNSSERDRDQNNNNNFSGPHHERYYGRRGAYADSDAEWQRTGQTSDQSWWDSGTGQQQEYFRGDTGYPYRENYEGRNQQPLNRTENYYPQEPASEQQRRNFAEGSQYPYEGGYGAGNPQARQGIERAQHLNGPDQAEGLNREEQGRRGFLGYQNGGMQDMPDLTPEWVKERQTGVRGQDQIENMNQSPYQDQSTLRSGGRNYGTEYNEYRRQDEDFGRDRDGSRNLDFGNRGRMGDSQYDRYERVNYRSGRENDRGYGQTRDYGRDRFEQEDRNFNRSSDYNESRGHNEGRYHSTRTENPGRGYETEQELNRHAGSYYGDQDRRRDIDYGSRGRDFRRQGSERVRSAHRSEGPYEDFERDVNRFGIKGDYDERYDYNERRLDRGPSGSWGRNADYDYSDRYERERGRY